MLIGPVTSYQKMSLFSLTDYSSDIWTDPNQLQLSAYGITTTYDAYVWDLQSLAAYVGTPETSDNSNRIDLGDVPYFTISYDNSLWSQIWIQNFGDNAGSSVIARLPSFFAVSAYNKIQAEKYLYTGNFNFSPLVTFNDNNPTESYDGENVLYNAILNPGYPILIASTFPEHQHFGPVFITNVDFKVSGTGAASPVEVNVGLSGARSMRSPVLNLSDEIIITLPDGSTSGQVYRSASIIDCLVSEGIWTDVNSMQNDLDNSITAEASDPTLRIVGLTLNMKQDVAYSTPEPLDDFVEENGPRFVSISNRVVTGSITFFARTDSMEQITTDSLTIYFGGPFLFPMSNIEWQKPSAAFSAGNGFTRTYSFLARAADDCITLPFQITGDGYPSSEFDIPSVAAGNSSSSDGSGSSGPGGNL